MSDEARPLGYMETRMHLMHTLFRGSTQGVVALRVRGALEPARFTRAVQQVVDAHALLRSTIVDRGDHFELACQPRAELPLRVLARQSEQHWQELMQTEVESALDPTRGVFRLTLLTDGAESDILLSVHHAIMDGSAVDHFLDQILSLASGETDVAPQARGLPPNAEQMVPKRMRLSWSDFLAAQRAASERSAGERPSYVEPAPLAERRTKTAWHALSTDDVQAIETRCSARGVTFNALASAALLVAVHRASPERTSILLNSTFSLRRLCNGLGEDDLGCYMSIIPTLHAFGGAEPSLLDLAATHHALLSAAILQGARCPVDVPLEQIREGTASLTSVREFVQDIGLTYGESSLKASYGELSLAHMYATVNRTVGTLAAVVHGVKLGSRAFFTINHTQPLQSRSWAEDVTREFVAAFTVAARASA